MESRIGSRFVAPGPDSARRAGLTGTVPSRFPQALRLRYGQGIARMAGWGWPRVARDYPVFDSAYDQLFNSHDVTHGEPFPCGLCGFLSGPTVEAVYEYRQAPIRRW